MKEISRSESLLNDYIMNTSELSSSHQQTCTIQSINNNLSQKLQNRNSSIKKNPFSEYSYKINNISKLEINNNNLINFIESNNIEKIIEYLDKDISKINMLNENGVSALHIAVINGRLDIINILLKYGANPNITSLDKKQTPLHFAYIFKSIAFNQIINLLLKYNANPNLEDINNKKPYEYALKYKESNEVDITLSDENDKNEKNNDNLEKEEKSKNITNEDKDEDSYNDDNNINNNYTISDSESTITQIEAKNGFNIEELINYNKENQDNNKENFKIIGKNKKYNKDSFRSVKQKNLVLNKNNFNNTLNDSLDLNNKDKIINNYYYNINLRDNNFMIDNNINKNFPKRKSIFSSSYKNIQFRKKMPLGISLGFNENNTYNSEKKRQNKNRDINIYEQYYINNGFLNNYYNDIEYLKLRAKRRTFKISKNAKSSSNSGFLSSSLSTTANQTTKNNKISIIMNNNVTEFIYPEDNSYNNEPDKKQILKNWLSSIELPFYYDNFIKNNISDINKLINEVKINHQKINYEYLENLLKIHKSGHIYRILCKLEVDAGFVENKIYNFLVGINMNKIEDNSNKNNSNFTAYSQYKEFNNKSCNCCNIKKPLIEKMDLKNFLSKYQLLHLYDNFCHNGFNLINFVILQMYTKYSINDGIIQKCLHIYKKKDRYLVLDALFNEVKEINIFFSTNFHNHYFFPKYENNNWNNSFCDESLNSENENSNNCIII